MKPFLQATTANIVGGVLAGVLLIVVGVVQWKRILVIGVLLESRIEAPLWSIVAGVASVAALGGAAAWMGARRRYHQPPERDTRIELSRFGVTFQVTREIRGFRATPATTLTTDKLDTIVQGPYCSVKTCRRPLTRGALSSSGSSFLMLIDNPCPECGNEVDKAALGRGYYHLKQEVFTEAQRILELAN